MMSTCSAPVKKQQKLLLKVLNCLWNQYVSNRTGYTKAFFASPSVDKYNLMKNELYTIASAINANTALMSLSIVDGKEAFANITSVFPNGSIAYNYANDVNVNSPSISLNTFDNAQLGTIFNNPVNFKPNMSGSKNIQNLNTDECLPQAFQIIPALSQNPVYAPTMTNGGPITYITQPTWITQASVTERTGCSGVSNTGFISFSIEVDLEYYQFNSCENLSISCNPKKCNKH